MFFVLFYTRGMFVDTAGKLLCIDTHYSNSTREENIRLGEAFMAEWRGRTDALHTHVTVEINPPPDRPRQSSLLRYDHVSPALPCSRSRKATQ